MIGRKSITVRLTLLFAGVSTTVLLLLGLIVGSLAERHFEELDMEVLMGKLELLQHTLSKVDSAAALASLRDQLDDSLVGHHGLSVVVLSGDGRTLFSTDDRIFPEALIGGVVGKGRPIVWTDAGKSFRGLSAEVRTGVEGAPPLTIALSTDIEHHEQFMQSFRLALWAVVGGAALLSGFLGWFAARRGLEPLREIGRMAAGVTATRLDRRLSVESIPSELAEVAATLNAMLARLEESFERLSAFSSDLAHELRTPVSNLLTQTQVTLTRARTADDYRDVLASNAEEFERLSRMIADMLFLAKSDNHLIVPHRERVDLIDEVRELLEFYEALADEKAVNLTWSGNGIVSGDRLMLRRAISNLLSNAIRHTPAGGYIAVKVSETAPSSVTLSVENSGDTITPEHLPRLFDRFYRVAASRGRSGEGAGLGLAITRSIARAHGGDASVRSASGITTFALRLPAHLSIS
jgi:two-component system heavy metal sensor histidine kinase CusS